jgi:hypothetical protein
MKAATCSPGSHPHADRANWQPADTLEGYLTNIREGLEDFSDRRACALLGWSRAKLWRVRQAGRLPEPLFERLLHLEPMPSWREMANIARSLLDGEAHFEASERCPSCGHALRVRRRFSKEAAEAVSAWIEEVEPLLDAEQPT